MNHIIDILIKKREILEKKLNDIIWQDKKTFRCEAAKILVSESHEVPISSLLTFQDVQDIKLKNSKGFFVVGPQAYNEVTFLDASQTEELKYFKDTGKGLVYTGGSFEDVWWKVSPDLEEFLQKWTTEAEFVLKKTFSPSIRRLIKSINILLTKKKIFESKLKEIISEGKKGDFSLEEVRILINKSVALPILDELTFRNFQNIKFKKSTKLFVVETQGSGDPFWKVLPRLFYFMKTWITEARIVLTNKNLIKYINFLLKKKTNLEKLLFKIIDTGKMIDSRYKAARDLIYKRERVPRSALLTSLKINEMKLNNSKGVYVVESPWYDTVTFVGEKEEKLLSANHWWTVSSDLKEFLKKWITEAEIVLEQPFSRLTRRSLVPYENRS
jgi:hypothetical protein